MADNKNNRKGSGNYRVKTELIKSRPEKPEDHPMQEEPTPTTNSLKKKVRLPITSGELRLRMQGIQLEKSLKILR